MVTQLLLFRIPCWYACGDCNFWYCLLGDIDASGRAAGIKESVKLLVETALWAECIWHGSTSFFVLVNSQGRL